MTVPDHVSQEAIFIGANRHTFVADFCAAEKLVAFGAANTVALWKPLAPDNKGVYHTLKKHQRNVTGVRFVGGGKYLVSVGEDGEVTVWKNDGKRFGYGASLKFHTQSITCLTVVNEVMFATGSADGQVAIWIVESRSENWVLGHSFLVKQGFYPLSIAVQEIGANGDYVVAIGGTSSHLFIYSLTVEGGGASVKEFEASAVLTGHEDWIKCLEFVEENDKSFILASGSQDRYVRLWRLRINEGIDDTDEDDLKLVLLQNKQYKFYVCPGLRASFCFEALIMGHDDWVTDLKWHPSCFRGVCEDRKLQLLTSTADTALMIWEMDVESGIWCCVNRLGEMSIKGASTATGASGGFWSCLWFADDAHEYILANGKTGSFRMYKTLDNDKNSWESSLGITGPTKDVTDLAWSLSGDYVMATSLDQTTRLLAPWTENREYRTWHEIARPQIHGYDMTCLDNITSTKLVSGGEEKILRVFEMTSSIRKLLTRLCGISVSSYDEVLPESASLPVLGLSNKAANEQLEAGELHEVEDTGNEDRDQSIDILDTLTMPPFEDHLQRYTLFPEVEKLYGHGYEITCCATSPNGVLIASACRSNNARHAVIRVFNVKNDYQQCEQILSGHNLSITSLEFSPDGKYLVAVSRDRQVSLWAVTDEVNGSFELVNLNQKAHSRIIWDCSWTPTNSYGTFFLTVARDKTMKLWQLQKQVSNLSQVKLSDPVTTISCYKSKLFAANIVVAVGTENGAISIYTVDLSSDTKPFHHILSIDSSLTPAGRVSKLSFSIKSNDEHKLLLALASSDSSVRIYTIDTSMIS